MSSMEIKITIPSDFIEALIEKLNKSDKPKGANVFDFRLGDLRDESKPAEKSQAEDKPETFSYNISSFEDALQMIGKLMEKSHSDASDPEPKSKSKSDPASKKEGNSFSWNISSNKEVGDAMLNVFEKAGHPFAPLIRAAFKKKYADESKSDGDPEVDEICKPTTTPNEALVQLSKIFSGTQVGDLLKAFSKKTESTEPTEPSKEESEPSKEESEAQVAERVRKEKLAQQAKEAFQWAVSKNIQVDPSVGASKTSPDENSGPAVAVTDAGSTGVGKNVSDMIEGLFRGNEAGGEQAAAAIGSLLETTSKTLFKDFFNLGDSEKDDKK